jgi:uncharacterized protein
VETRSGGRRGSLRAPSRSDTGRVSDEFDLLRSRPARLAVQGAGFACIGLAVAGAFLPVLPTTPFVLLAAACFARSSPRFHRWLLEHRLFGPLIRDWQAHGTIPLKTKRFAIALLVLSLGSSIAFGVHDPRLRIGLAILGVGLVVMLLRIPTRLEDSPPS